MTYRRQLLDGVSRGVVAAHAFGRRFRVSYRCTVNAHEVADRKAWAEINKGDICTLLRPLLISKGIPPSRVDRGDTAFEAYASPSRDALMLEFS